MQEKKSREEWDQKVNPFHIDTVTNVMQADSESPESEGFSQYWNVSNSDEFHKLKKMPKE